VAAVEAAGITFDCDVAGTGEPVVFVHGAFIADAFGPVVREPALAGYQCITYARRGYGKSSRSPGPTTIERQAEDCRAFIAALGFERVHLVGHSYGGSIALDLCLGSPSVVASLTLMEPALLLGASADGYRAGLAATTRRAAEAGMEPAMHEFLEIRSPGYRERVERMLPGAFEQAVRDAPTTIEDELPYLPGWPFDETRARRIGAPVLSVLGEASRALSPRFEEAHLGLLDWIPRAEGVVVPGATHLMQFDAPEALAEAIGSFLQRHPL
jgi:pimeloyl-ACP methyl ester carboxylesterase